MRALKKIVRDAPEATSAAAARRPAAARADAMSQLMAGSEGRAWLAQGTLARATVGERFKAHLGVMAQDAKPHSGTSRWRRYWWGGIARVREIFSFLFAVFLK